MNLQIAGGTYIESCQFPDWNEVYGSGLRAAEAVTGLGGTVEFFTYICKEQEPALTAKAADLKISVRQIEIPQTVSFEYVHGFSTPVIYPPTDSIGRLQREILQVNGDAVLRFGLLEGDAKVCGKRVVYDPQNPHAPEAFEKNGSTAEELAIVCNKTEGAKLTNESEPEKIAAKLIALNGCKVVVVKCGSQGAVVASGGSVEYIPAYKTEFVWPIGSGDVFAAVFAYSWAASGVDPVVAANLASKATAFYCEKRHLRFPNPLESNFINEPLPLNKRSKTVKVYLAGPFFSMAQIWLINEAYAALESQGLEVFSPLHHVGKGPADKVYEPDIQGIRDSDIIFACVDGLDSGTLYEIGFAKALGKPVVVFVENEKEEDLKMLDGSHCIISKDFVTAIYKTAWLANT